LIGNLVLSYKYWKRYWVLKTYLQFSDKFSCYLHPLVG
jgi:hypothetical protein